MVNNFYQNIIPNEQLMSSNFLASLITKIYIIVMTEKEFTVIGKIIKMDSLFIKMDSLFLRRYCICVIE